MKLAVRRRLAVGALATSTALVVGLVVAPSAYAGNVTGVNPTNAFNNDNSEVVTLTTQSNFTPYDPVVGTGTSITFTRSADPTDKFSVPSDTFADPNHPEFTVDFQNTGSGATDGGANPGLYDIDVDDDRLMTHDSCKQCFTVYTPDPGLDITGAAPTAIAAGSAANVTFSGIGFARGTRIEFLLPSGAVDAAITVGPPTQTGSVPQCAQRGQAPGCTVEIGERTSNTSMLRRISIADTDTAGPRSIRVTNTDGATDTCQNCFTVNGAPLTSVSPNSAVNSPSATGTVRITFTGPAVPQSGTPQLVFTGTNSGSATKNQLTLTGTSPTFSPTSVAANFDFRNAAPGNGVYTPTLLQSDGSVNGCTCTFSVAQSSPPTVTSLNPSAANQSDSRTVTINGSNFSKGVKINFSGTGIDVTSVEFVSNTQVRASIKIQSTAATGKRDVSATLTNGVTGPLCSGCFTVNASNSPSATPTATQSPGSCPSKAVTIRVNTPTINATGNASVTVTGATPTATIELQGYSQNHFGTANFDNDPTPVDRTAKADNNGAATFNDLKPASNTRLRARQAGCAFGNSAVVEVRAQETLTVKRVGPRKYTFSGRSIPARPGGLIISLYRIVGSSCAPGVEPSKCPGEKFVGQNRAAPLGASNEGLYSITITFPASDSNVRDEFVVKTGRDAQNAPGRSNARSLLIY